MTKERIQAQHEETGRMWEGPRDQLPKGYSELPPSKDLITLQAPAGEIWAPADPDRCMTVLRSLATGASDRDYNFAYLAAFAVHEIDRLHGIIRTLNLQLNDRRAENEPPGDVSPALDYADAIAERRASQPPAVVQDMEKIAWCQKVHEDLAVYVDDGGGQMIHVRAKRALGFMFEEMQKLEKALYPSLTKGAGQ